MTPPALATVYAVQFEDGRSYSKAFGEIRLFMDRDCAEDLAAYYTKRRHRPARVVALKLVPAEEQE